MRYKRTPRTINQFVQRPQKRDFRALAMLPDSRWSFPIQLKIGPTIHQIGLRQVIVNPTRIQRPGKIRVAISVAMLWKPQYPRWVKSSDSEMIVFRSVSLVEVLSTSEGGEQEFCKQWPIGLDSEGVLCVFSESASGSSSCRFSSTDCSSIGHPQFPQNLFPSGCAELHCLQIAMDCPFSHSEINPRPPRELFSRREWTYELVGPTGGAKAEAEEIVPGRGSVPNPIGGLATAGRGDIVAAADDTGLAAKRV